MRSAVKGTVTFTFSFAPLGEKFAEGASIGDAPDTQAFTVIQLVHAEVPVFRTNLSGSKIYKKGDAAEALHLRATVTDGGKISYQWYVNGTAIAGATGMSYTPDTGKTGVYDYYVVATNTNSSANGDQTATAQSGSYRVVVNNVAVNGANIEAGAPRMTIQGGNQAFLNAALTAQDKIKLENGFDISVSLKVRETVNVTRNDENAVKQILGNNVLGQFVDISFVKTLIDPEGNKSEQIITQLNLPVTITIDIPENLLPKDGKNRTFSIIQIQNGVATLLEDMDDTLSTITIEVDGSSTYAIVYMDKPTEILGTGKALLVIASLVVAASLLLVAIILIRKKEAAGAESKS